MSDTQKTILESANDCRLAAIMFGFARKEAHHAALDVAHALYGMYAAAAGRDWPTMQERRMFRAAERACAGNPRLAREMLAEAGK